MHDPINTEQRAASILLDRGVGWRLPAPWPVRLLKKSVMVSVKPLRLGTLLELSRLYKSMNIDPSQVENNPHSLFEKVPTMARIAAVCLLNSPLKIRLFAPLVGRFLLRRLTGGMLLEMMLFIVTYSGTSDFISIIRLVDQMKMTTPNLSHKDQGS